MVDLLELELRPDTRRTVPLAEAAVRTGLPEAEVLRLLEPRERSRSLTPCRVRQLAGIRAYRLRLRAKRQRKVVSAEILAHNDGQEEQDEH